MAKLSDLATNQYVKVLLYGDSGSTKTTTACGFPGPVHVLDFDNKVGSAASWYAGKPQIEQISYENYGPVDDKGTAFEKCSMDLAKMKREKTFPGTIVLDSLTTFADEVMKYLIRINPGISRTNTKGVTIPAMQDYQIARLYFKQHIMELLNWPCNVVVTAHIQTDKDEVTGEILRTPMLPGKLSNELPIYFPEVYRCGWKENKPIAQTKSDSKFKCRTQIRGLPAEVPMDNLYQELTKAR